MGKLRAKHRVKSRRRPQPTGIPSVKEQQDLEPAPQPDIPVLEKVRLFVQFLAVIHPTVTTCSDY